MVTQHTLGLRKRAMTVKHILDTGLLLQCVDVLAVVAQQLSLLLQEAHKVV